MRDIEGVLFYCNYSPPYAGNFIISLTKLSIRLKEKYKSKIVFSFPRDAEKCPWIKGLKENVDYIFFSDMNSIKDGIRLGIILRKYNISIVHSHFVWSKFFAYANIGLLMKKNIKVFVHVHNHCWDESKILTKVYRHLILLNKRFIACGPTVADSVINNGYNKNLVSFVTNAIDFERLEKYEKIKKHGIVCMIFGFDPQRKGVDLAIKAIDELRTEKCLDITLIIPISKDEDKAKRTIIEMVGHIPKWCIIVPPREDIATYYRSSNVFLSPSREEGLCYSVIEAYYCNTPVIATDIPGLQEIKLNNIQWIPNESVIRLKEKLFEVFNSNKLRWSMQEEEARKKYGLDRWVEEILDNYMK